MAELHLMADTKLTELLRRLPWLPSCLSATGWPVAASFGLRSDTVHAALRSS